MKNILHKNIACSFVLMTMGITWVLWWSIVIANSYGFLLHGTPIMMTFYIVGGLAPAISAITLILKSKLMDGKRLFKTICDFKQPISLYILVIFIAIITFVIPLLINKAIIHAPIYMSLLLLPVNLMGGGLEEIGWRFLFQPELEKKINFIFATIITAIVWALWHLPLFYMDGTNQSQWSFWAFAILALGMSFILASIYRVSKSVLLCILFHTVWNAIGESIAVSMDIFTSSVISIALILISFILTRVYKNCANKKMPD